MLYLTVPFCDAVEDETCLDVWDESADFMRNRSFSVFYGLLGMIFASLIGFTVMFWGFGVGSERTSKIVRDKSFSNVLRQEVREFGGIFRRFKNISRQRQVGWFDLKSPGALASRLGDDAALLHSFTGEPIRSVCSSLSSVFIGIIVSMVYMW